MITAILKEIAEKVEAAEPTAHCHIDNLACQIIVSFDKRKDVEVELLTPYARNQVKKGYIDNDVYSELLFSIKSIANYSL